MNGVSFILVTVEFLRRISVSTMFLYRLFEAYSISYICSKKLLIFATFSDTQLFVPALLCVLGLKDVDKHRVVSNPTLALQFPDGGSRKGIFCSLSCLSTGSHEASSMVYPS